MPYSEQLIVREVILHLLNVKKSDVVDPSTFLLLVGRLVVSIWYLNFADIYLKMGARC